MGNFAENLNLGNRVCPHRLHFCIAPYLLTFLGGACFCWDIQLRGNYTSRLGIFIL